MSIPTRPVSWIHGIEILDFGLPRSLEHIIRCEILGKRQRLPDEQVREVYLHPEQ
jgi:hypothetical protein